MTFPDLSESVSLGSVLTFLVSIFTVISAWNKVLAPLSKWILPLMFPAWNSYCMTHVFLQLGSMNQVSVHIGEELSYWLLILLFFGGNYYITNVYIPRGCRKVFNLYKDYEDGQTKLNDVILHFLCLIFIIIMFYQLVNHFYYGPILRVVHFVGGEQEAKHHKITQWINYKENCKQYDGWPYLACESVRVTALHVVDNDTYLTRLLASHELMKSPGAIDSWLTAFGSK